MLTIEDASRVFSLNEVEKLKENDLKELPKSFAFAISMESFRAGVEFAQRWIPIEEELPEKYEFVLLKLSDSKYEVGFILGNGYFAYNVNPTHWRPINYK